MNNDNTEIESIWNRNFFGFVFRSHGTMNWTKSFRQMFLLSSLSLFALCQEFPKSVCVCVWGWGLRIHYRNFCEFCPNISQRQNINHNFAILLRRNVERDTMMEIELFTYALFQPIYTISSHRGSKFTKQIYFNLTRKLVYISKSKWKVSNRRNSKEKKQHKHTKKA